MSHQENKDELARLIDTAVENVRIIREKTYAMVGRNKMSYFDPKFDEFELYFRYLRGMVERDFAELPVSVEEIADLTAERLLENVCRDFLIEGRLITAVRACHIAHPSWTLTECKLYVESLK